MDFTITKDNIMLAKCITYETRENDELISTKMSINDIFRKVLVFRGRVIDFATADDLLPLEKDQITGEIYGKVEAYTIYFEELYPHPDITNEDLEYIPTLLSTYQEKKLMEKEKKLIKMPRRRLN